MFPSCGPGAAPLLRPRDCPPGLLARSRPVLDHDTALRTRLSQVVAKQPGKLAQNGPCLSETGAIATGTPSTSSQRSLPAGWQRSCCRTADIGEDLAHRHVRRLHAFSIEAGLGDITDAAEGHARGSSIQVSIQ